MADPAAILVIDETGFLKKGTKSALSEPTLRVLCPPPAARITAAPVLRPRSTVCTSMDGLWMLTMLLMRPGTVWLMLYCSASRMRPALRKDEPGGYRVTTTPPGRIGCGA